MKTFDFVCLDHPEEIRTLKAASLRDVSFEERSCNSCGQAMERYFGKTVPQIALKGSNWPKRDIKETAKRKKRSRELGKIQKKVWDPHQPKLNLDPDVQSSFREQFSKKDKKLTVKKL